MAPVDLIIGIIERKQKVLRERSEESSSAVEDLIIQGGFEALEDLKNELEGFKRLFN